MSSRKYARQKAFDESMERWKKERELVLQFCDSPDCPGRNYSADEGAHQEHKCGGTAEQRARSRRAK